jgi:hypothetical protein
MFLRHTPMQAGGGMAAQAPDGTEQGASQCASI